MIANQCCGTDLYTFPAGYKKHQSYLDALTAALLDQPGRCILDKGFGWYDVSIRIKGNKEYEQRFAGRIETGKPTQSDPAMGFMKG